jgi:predicted NBD/HSP70 family sugar kinase
MMSRFPDISEATPARGALLSGTNLEHAGDHNQRVTLHAIRLLGPVTRTELAEVTGLTAPAVANITRRLLDLRMITAAGMRQGARGQPATRLVINPESSFSVGINVDRDHITMVAVDFEGSVRARAAREVDFALPGTVRAFFQDALDRLIRQGGIPRERLVGIGVALPDDLGTIEIPGRPERYSEWSKVQIGELLTNPLGLPVFVENDAAAAAMGELQFGIGQRTQSFFYLLISSALGGGLIVDGSYFRGATGRSAEVGFLPVRNSDGSQVPLQNIVSLSGLAGRLEAVGVDLRSARTSRSFSGKAEAIVAEWIEAAAEALVEPLIAINCLINPGAILIGGRLPSELVDRLSVRVNQMMQKRAGEIPAVAPVMRAALSEDAPAVGAAILPFSHFLLPRSGALMKTERAAPSHDGRAPTSATMT